MSNQNILKKVKGSSIKAFIGGGHVKDFVCDKVYYKAYNYKSVMMGRIVSKIIRYCLTSLKDEAQGICKKSDSESQVRSYSH